MFGEREQPISEERIEELRATLSEDAAAIFDYMNGLIGTEEDNTKELMLLAERANALPDDEREAFDYAFSEIRKAYDHFVKENEAESDFLRDGMADMEQAQEIDPNVRNMGEANRLLKEHGITPRLSDEDMKRQLEVPPPETWVRVPGSEIPTDKNGIPTKAAARNGWGFRVGLGDDAQMFKMNAQETTAMRILAESVPYEEFYRDFAEETGTDPRKLYEEVYQQLTRLLELADDAPDEQQVKERAEKQATEFVQAHLHNAYLASLATAIRETENLQGFIDFGKGKDTAAARRYKEETVKEEFSRQAYEYEQELIDRGVFEEVTGGDGKEYLKPGPNFEEWQKEVEEARREEEDGD